MSSWQAVFWGMGEGWTREAEKGRRSVALSLRPTGLNEQISIKMPRRSSSRTPLSKSGNLRGFAIDAHHPIQYDVVTGFGPKALLDRLSFILGRRAKAKWGSKE